MWISAKVELKPAAPASTASWTTSAMSCTSSSLGTKSGSTQRSPRTKLRTAACPICGAKSMTAGLCSKSSRNCGKVSQLHLIPSCSAVPGMSSTPSISSIRKSWSSDQQGAKVTPQLPKTTDVTPCQHEGLSVGSHPTCAS